MRLRQIQDAVSENLPLLTATRFENVPIPGNIAGVKITRWREARRGAAGLAEVEVLAAPAKAFLELPWGQLADDPGIVQQDFGARISDFLQRLLSATHTLNQVLSALLPAEDPSTVSVKLPPVQDLKELSNVIEDVHLALARPADVLFGPCIRFNNVDVGSTWVEIVVQAASSPVGVATTGAVAVGVLRKNILGFLAGLVDLYGTIVRQRHRQKLVDAHLRSIGIGDDVRRNADERCEQAIEKLSEEKIRQLIEIYGADREHQADALAASLHAAKIGPLLLERGAEVHPRRSSGAFEGASAEEVQQQRARWPDPKEVGRLLAPVVGQLEENTESNDNSRAPESEGKKPA